MKDEIRLAIISNTITPYRVNLHKHLSQSIPNILLHSVFTHGTADFKWNVELPDSIHPTFIGRSSHNASEIGVKFFAREWRKGAKIIKYIQSQNINFVIVNGYAYASYLRVVNYCKKNSIPIFIRSDSNILGDRDLSRFKSWLKKIFVGQILRRCDGVMSAGRMGRKYFQKYGVVESKIFNVPFLPDWQMLQRVDSARLDSFFIKFGLNANRKYIGYSGRLIDLKRVDLLIDAFCRVAKLYEKYDLLIAGDGELKKSLYDRIPDDFKHRVKWLGFLDSEHMPLFYASIQLIVLPSSYEPWALVVQEAFASGTPLLCSDSVGAAYDYVEEGRNGELFSSGDLTELVAVLEKMIQNLNQTYQKNAESMAVHFAERCQPEVGLKQAINYMSGAIDVN